MKNNQPSLWVVYIIKCSDDTLYTGITTDLSRRIQEHESGAGAKYTKGRGPFKIIYTEPSKNRSDASKRELEVKSLNKKDKLKLAEVNHA